MMEMTGVFNGKQGLRINNVAIRLIDGVRKTLPGKVTFYETDTYLIFIGIDRSMVISKSQLAYFVYDSSDRSESDSAEKSEAIIES